MRAIGVGRLSLDPPLGAVVLDSDKPIWVNACLWERDKRAEFLHVGIVGAVWLKEFGPPGVPVNRRSFFVVIRDGYVGSREILEEGEGVNVGRLGRGIQLRERDVDGKVHLQPTLCKQRLYTGGTRVMIGFGVGGMSGEVTKEAGRCNECLGARCTVVV